MAAAAKAKMAAALSKPDPVPEEIIPEPVAVPALPQVTVPKAPVAQKQVTFAGMSAPAAQTESHDAVSTNAYKMAINSVLHPKKRNTQPKVDKAVVAQLGNHDAAPVAADGVADAVSEPQGFIGAYS